jgi:hypothetical protein
MTLKKLNILFRTRVLVNTDPQRRCYNGCHAKSELQWTDWGVLEYEVPEDRIEQRLNYWRSLNDYAVSQRGEGARRECKAVPVEAPDANP